MYGLTLHSSESSWKLEGPYCVKNGVFSENISVFPVYFIVDIVSVTWYVGVPLTEETALWVAVYSEYPLEEGKSGAFYVAVVVTWKYSSNTDETNQQWEAIKLRKFWSSQKERNYWNMFCNYILFQSPRPKSGHQFLSSSHRYNLQISRGKFLCCCILACVCEMNCRIFSFSKLVSILK